MAKHAGRERRDRHHSCQHDIPHAVVLQLSVHRTHRCATAEKAATNQLSGIVSDCAQTALANSPEQLRRPTSGRD
jgi:hypothetical protein